MNFDEWKEERKRIWGEMETELDRIEGVLRMWRKRGWEISRNLGGSVRKLKSVGELDKAMERVVGEVDELKASIKTETVKYLSLEVEREDLRKRGFESDRPLTAVDFVTTMRVMREESEVFVRMVGKLGSIAGYIEAVEDVVKGWVVEEEGEDDVLGVLDKK